MTREPLQYGLDARGIGVGPAAFEALEGALDALALDGLQEIVDCGGLERLQRVVVEGGDEHDERAGREPLE